MTYLVLGYDGNDTEAPKRRQQAREDHLKMSAKLKEAGNALYAVAMLNEQQEMIGSVYIVDFDSRAELDKWLEEEPYVIGNVWQKIEIKPCKVPPAFM